MSQGIPVFDSYMMLIVEYAMIKMHMLGIAAYHNGLSQEMAVKIIQSYTKNYEHSAFFHKNIMDDLKRSKYDGLGYMSLLIKN
jgi:lysine-N-methylase